MSGTGNLIVQPRDDGGPKAALAELVQAWARDASTGDPVHILELGLDRRGAKSGCECPSCGLPVIAVNAGKTEFVRRPHFRHPEGAPRDECMLLAARAAALRQLQEDGCLDLPRRRKSARAIGLSGEIHEAWVEQGAERVRITEIDFRDRVAALLTLDDGRQLRVELTGTLVTDAPLVLDSSGHPVPTILLAVDDRALAGMSPEDVRGRLKLLPDALCWRSHWNDDQLALQASDAARDLALLHFDDVPDGLDLPSDLAPLLKRQTVLHYEVMRLLAESKHLRVPRCETIQVSSAHKHVQGRQAVIGSELLCVEFVELEKRFDNIVPDVTCKARSAELGETWWPLFIEVTVTNHVTSERLERISEAGRPTLEIDLSLAGGRIDRDGLRQMVIDGVEIKRWLFHPRQAQLEELRKLSITELGKRYLDACLHLADAEAAEDSSGGRLSEATAQTKAARAVLSDVVVELDARGYSEAGDANLIGQHGMVFRMLSIQLGRPVGYRLQNVAGVLNAIEQSKGVRQADASVYLIAVRAYKPALNEKQQDWFEDWASRVRESLKQGESTYARDPTYDRLLSMLFPEMADGLAKPVGKRRAEDAPAHGDWKAAKRLGVPTRQRATFLTSSPLRNDPDLRAGGHWLTGEALKAWKLAHPDAARNWFGEGGDGESALPDSRDQ